MRRVTGAMLLAVVVITGWVLALLWLALSVTQIAVHRVATPDLMVCSADAGERPCWP